MIAALSSFRILNLLYQAISTFLVYGLSLFDSSYIAISRELIWCLIVFIVFIIGFSQVKSYRQKWKWSRYSFIILGIVSVLFSLFINHTSFGNIFIGLKYGFQWMFVLLTSSFLGFILSQKIQSSKLLQKMPRILVGIVWVGFLRQGAKLIRPDFFFSLGYGSLDDYAYGDNPPIYYLTGYEGTLRWQGLFSGPNNYGYFLVAFLPLTRTFFTKKIKEKSEKKSVFILSFVVIILWMSAMIMTLSRAVLIGLVVCFVLLYRHQLKHNKKIMLRGGIGIVAALVGLSVLKRESTLGHIASKVDVIPEIIAHPLGHGLGSSGPAVHYEGKFLPENYYFQIMLDIGTVGFLIRAITMFFIFKIQSQIIKESSKSQAETEICQSKILYALEIGFFALLIMGLFLHVFEDSMVNYLFFTIYGIVLGSLSKDGKKQVNKKLFILCGPSGVGKTTRARHQIDNSQLKCAHISRDLIRFSIVKENEPYFSHEDEVIQKFLSNCSQELHKGDSEIIFLDSTHLTEKVRNKDLKAIKIPKSVDVYAVNFRIPEENCLKQNELRKSQGRAYVAPDVIRKMYEQFIPATLNEKYHYKAIYEINEDNRQNIIL